jgi:hypothetical protein
MGAPQLSRTYSPRFHVREAWCRDATRRTRLRSSHGMPRNAPVPVPASPALDSRAQYDHWGKLAGFSRTEVLPLTGPTSTAIAYKAP